MNYKQTLQYLFDKLPMFHRIGPAAYKSNLNNTLMLAEHLGNPQQHFKSIHIAGTNGKGSVSHMLAAILQESGYKTGLYTSPHLLDFRERIRVNGQMIRESYVIDFTEKLKAFIEEVQPSFFEITVGMAFSYFTDQAVDIAVIETGLGGRLDSTNIITPELSVITSISLDHQNLLGGSIEKIVIEKAGIIKSGIPVVIGEKKKETWPIFRRIAAERNAPITFAEDLYSYKFSDKAQPKLTFCITDKEGKKFTVETDLKGSYQGKNILTVLSATGILQQRGFGIKKEQIINGIAKTAALTELRGRWEHIGNNPKIICDIAHNEGAISEVIKQLNYESYQKLHIVFGVSQDKSLELLLPLMPHDALYYFCKPSVPRGMEAVLLAEEARTFDLNGLCYNNVGAAVRGALEKAGKDDMILITGSAFVVADALKYLENIPENETF